MRTWRTLICFANAAFFLAAAQQPYRGIPLEQQRWLAAVLVSIASSGQRISRVFLAGGLIYFCATLSLRLRGVARRLLTRFGEVVLEVGA